MRKTADTVSDQDLDQLTSLFQLLSDKTRLKILFLLADGERNVSALCQDLALPQPTVSHHLGLLRTRNLIGNRRQGKQVFYALTGSLRESGQLDLQMGLDRFNVTVSPKLI